MEETAMDEGVLAAIGNTPLIRLKRVLPDIPFRLFAKLESLNPGGSTKDRPAASVIKRGMETGAIGPRTVVVESSSGNMGVGLAQVCSYLGLRFICVVDPKITPQNLRMLKAYGAEVEYIMTPDPQTGEYLKARIGRVCDIMAELGDAFWPNQYANPYNPVAHHQTMREIVNALGGEVDYLFCAASTCGTMRGCAEFIKTQGLSTKVYAVDAVGSVIFGGEKAKRLIPGHGAALRPELYQHDLADECIHVTDLECVTGCRRLVRQEALLVGGSSGAVISAVEHARHDLKPGSTCVAIFPDRGERYLDTIYSDTWVEEHFGDVSRHWETAAKDTQCVTATY
jgi:2,3-diaminopropionate biosynthesis protein SbnA